MKNLYRYPTADEADAMVETRRRPAYVLARIWMERAIASHPQPFTKSCRLGVESAAILLKAAYIGYERNWALNRVRPTIAAALEDEDAAVSVALAASDLGAKVELARSVYSGRPVLACNFREHALRAMERERQQMAIADAIALSAWPVH